ncbi:MAG: SpoIID/LytB domain-containing protein [Microthrixaceae bacterium]|nr:SpoIID/LytB domain-containing protein [Microthrixaceae bacterium]
MSSSAPSHSHSRPQTRGLFVILALAVALIGISFGSGPVSADPAAFTVSGQGWGHGVGMSQWGARGRAANRGETYDQILRYYYTGTTVTAATGISSNVRVLVSSGSTSLTLTATGATTFNGFGTVSTGTSVTITRSGSALVLSGALTGTTYSPVIVNLSTAGGPVAVSGADSYRYGTLTVDAGATSGLRAIVGSMTMQEYLLGIGEMASSWPIEALKAQATAARTFAQKQIATRTGNSAYADYSLNASMDGAYRGTRFENEGTRPNWVNAVNSTNNVVVLYNGVLIDAVFSASSGGHTANSETAWKSVVTYLRGVPDPDDLTGGNPNASWSATYTAAELGSWFGVGTATAIEVIGAVPPSQHLDKTTMRVTGTSGSVEVLGEFFRSTVNAKAGSSRVMKSSRFTINGSSIPTTTTPPSPTTTVANKPATGKLLTATAQGRQIIIAGKATDPDGPPKVRVVSTMGKERAVRDYYATNGKFLSTWTGGPGTRNVCVTLFDTPTGAATSLGCRDVVVK